MTEHPQITRHTLGLLTHGAFDGLDCQILAILGIHAARQPEGLFDASIREIAELIGAPKHKVSGALTYLIDYGALEVVEPARGPNPRQFRFRPHEEACALFGDGNCGGPLMPTVPDSLSEWVDA